MKILPRNWTTAFMDMGRSVFQMPTWVIATSSLFFVIFVGVLDYKTGTQISFSVFYLLPIALVTWFTNARIGFVTATVSALAWLLADLAFGIDFSHPVIPYWNTLVRYLVFLAVVFLESALKDVNHNLERRVEERTALLAAEIEERKRVEAQLERYTKRLSILHEIDQAILTAESLEAVALAVIGHLRNLPSCDHVSLILIDSETQRGTLFAAGDKQSEQNLYKRVISIDAFPGLLESLQKVNMYSIHDLRSSPLEGTITELFQPHDYDSLLSVPIFMQEELIGCLNLMSHDRNGFSLEYIDIGREIANQLGIAIKQARMIVQLRRSQENLQLLSQRLLEVQEAERRMIARELHDEIGQALTGIAYTLEVTAQTQTDAARNKFDQASMLVSELMEKISQMSLELRPALLDDLGLLPTLLWYLDRYSKQTKIIPILKHSGLEGQRLDFRLETAAFRIIQEALTNVARHSLADRVKVTIWLDQGVLGVQVEDEGAGFDVDAAFSSGNSSGLFGMRERAMLLNGKLTIESGSDTGTRVLAELPIGT